jgi:hypothetical protein
LNILPSASRSIADPSLDEENEYTEAAEVCPIDISITEPVNKYHSAEPKRTVALTLGHTSIRVIVSN